MDTSRTDGNSFFIINSLVGFNIPPDGWEVGGRFLLNNLKINTMKTTFNFSMFVKRVNGIFQNRGRKNAQRLEDEWHTKNDAAWEEYYAKYWDAPEEYHTCR